LRDEFKTKAGKKQNTMFRSYYLLKQQVLFVKSKIVGKKIIDIYTLKKDELIFELEGLYLHISVNKQYPYLFLSKYPNNKKQKICMWGDLLGTKVLDISIHHFDKYIRIELNGFNVEVFLYGKSHNLRLNLPKGSSIYFKEHSPIHSVHLRKFPFILPITDKESFLNSLRLNSQQLFVKALSGLLGNFSALLLSETAYRAGVNKNNLVGEIEKQTFNRIYSAIQSIGEEVNGDRCYLYYRKNKLEKLSLVKLTELEQSGFSFKSSENINDSVAKFASIRERDEQFGKLYLQLDKTLKNKLDYLERSLKKINEHENLEQKKKESELKGNLLLTFQREIEKGLKSVKLPNIFSEAQEEIEIKLNSAKSVPQNANQYFLKYKNIGEKKKILTIKKQTIIDEKNEIGTLKKNLENAESLNNLKKLEKKMVQRGLLLKPNKLKNGGSVKQFKKFNIGKGLYIYIGKNGADNDALTFEFAQKFDLWFHAQGAPGSHVILRKHTQGDIVSAEQIKIAAEFAAGYSKSKHSKTVPVIYTEVRFVSRIRKAPPGTVKIKNEQVLFVEPKSLN
jgi:predicted ribosome quality control (RQC) complex YloA/Tae2 family protein